MVVQGCKSKVLPAITLQLTQFSVLQKLQLNAFGDHLSSKTMLFLALSSQKNSLECENHQKKCMMKICVLISFTIHIRTNFVNFEFYDAKS